jgi:hypothetical protein
MHGLLDALLGRRVAVRVRGWQAELVERLLEHYAASGAAVRAMLLHITPSVAACGLSCVAAALTA